jgi:polar amino acid transport system substrate-binding protein
MDTRQAAVQDQEVRLLRVATTMVSLSFTAFTADFAGEIAGRLDGAEVEWVAMSVGKLLSEEHAPFDFGMQFLAITPERAAIVDFSDPCLSGNEALLAREDSPLARATTIEAVRGAVLAGLQGGTGMACIKDVIRPSRPPKGYEAPFYAAKAVADGEVDGAVFPAPIAISFSSQFRDTTVVGHFAGTREEYGIIFEKGNPLRERVNGILSQMRADGTFERLIQKWFPDMEGLPEIA